MIKKKNFLGAYRLPLWLTIALFVVFSLNSALAQTRVATIEDLENVRDNLDRDYILVADLDLGDIRNWQPIGTEQEPFTGVFNGNGHKIINMTIARWEETAVGLFGAVDGGRIENLGLESRNIVGCTFVGGLVGMITNESVVSGCFSVANITGNRGTGGLAGYVTNDSEVRNSYAAGSVTSEVSDAAGLVAMLQNSRVINSYATAEIDGLDGSGGLIGGRIQENTVTNSFWDTEASNMDESFGGEGLSSAQMINRESYPDAWDFEDIWQMRDGVTYPYLQWQDEPGEYNYPGGGGPTSLTAVPGDHEVFLSWNEPSSALQESFNIYRDNEVIANIDGENTEYRDEQVRNYQEYSYFVTAVWDDDSESRSTNEVSVTPHEDFAGGAGTEDEPYQIATAQQLNDVRYQPEAYYLQTADIDLGTAPWNLEEGWNPIGFFANHQQRNIFRGRYDGNGFTINSLTINRPESNHIGLFGYVSDAVFTDIDLQDVDITGNMFVGGLSGLVIDVSISGVSLSGEVNATTDYIGGLIGYMTDGQVEDSHFSGIVNGSRNRVGGLIGQALNGEFTNSSVEGEVNINDRYGGGLIGVLRDGLVEYCYVSGEVNGSREVGGLIGQNRASVRHSFFTGTLTSDGIDVGGLIGKNFGDIIGCYSDAAATGHINIGGLIGDHQGTITDSYSAGTVGGTDNPETTNIGGLVGVMNGDITDSYTASTVTGPGTTGGLAAVHTSGNAVNSYWDIQRTGQPQSPQGEGRSTEQMTYPYAANTFQNWDFDDIWQEDVDSNINRGYPYLRQVPSLISPNPTHASNPQPQDEADNVSVDLDRLQWEYDEHPMFTNPVGFRVYLNTTGEFADDDSYVWVPYVEGQAGYSTSDILPDRLEWFTNYYWKVVPTTTDGGDNRSSIRFSRQNLGRADDRNLQFRGDAENVPVWEFKTETSPHPDIARSPQPLDEAENISPFIKHLSWRYESSAAFTDPRGFKVYLSEDEEFEDSRFEWVDYVENQERFETEELLPDTLSHLTTYYWKVIPTTEEPDRNGRKTRLPGNRRFYGGHERDDAENVPVWSFTVRAPHEHPANAEDPTPEHTAAGVSPEIERLEWKYYPNPDYGLPQGFRVYINTTGAFGSNAPYSVVDYNEEETGFDWKIDLLLDPETTYYWRVIPFNDDGSAVDNPVWRFTTGVTDIEHDQPLPKKSELISNYPNPFNPETTIDFSLAQPAHVKINVYNILGQHVATLIDDTRQEGVHSVSWKGVDDNNKEAPSGVYLTRMIVDGQVLPETRKIMLLK